jgi:hypothetical protein
VDPTVLKRAVHYLFTKETKSSFAIEGETPNENRTSRFVATLMRADQFDPTRKQSLIELQNAIVDPRYAQKDWRDLQVYVGETLRTSPSGFILLVQNPRIFHRSWMAGCA